MDKNNETFARRLKSAREMRSLSMAELSAAVNCQISPQAIYKYEAGKMLPGSAVLIQLSRALDVPFDFFFRPFKVEISGIEFRKKSRLTAKERKSIEGIARDYVERYVEIEDIRGELNQSKNLIHFEVIDKRDAVAAASHIRKLWNFGNEPIPNVINMLENHGIIVIELSGSRDFDGLSGMADNMPVVVVNNNLENVERKRFTALHELGHLVLNFKDNVEEKTKEKICHLFASEMLLPIDAFRVEIGDKLNKRISLQDFAEIQKKYGISIDAMMYKAKHNDMIPESRHRNYHILKSTRPSFKEYAEKSRFSDEHCERFEKIVYEALDAELITLSKAAGLLGVSADKLIGKSMVL